MYVYTKYVYIYNMYVYIYVYQAISWKRHVIHRDFCQSNG